MALTLSAIAALVILVLREKDKQKLRHYIIESLENAGLITILPYDQRRKVSRRYKLTDNIWDGARKVENDFTRKAWKSLIIGDFEKYISVNLRNGEQLRDICGHTFERRDAHFKTPETVKSSIRAISNCVFDPKYAGRLVHALESAVKRALKNWKNTE